MLFFTVEQHSSSYDEVLQGVVYYKATINQWSEALFAESFFKGLPKVILGCKVVDLLDVAERVLVIIKHMERGSRHFFIVLI